MSMSYQKSQHHIENATNARNLASLQIKRNKLIRVASYDKNPRLCGNCSTAIHYDKRSYKFCSSSCAAAFNNKQRTVSQKHRDKTSNAVNQYYKNNPSIAKNRKQRAITILYKTCAACRAVYTVTYKNKNKKTCSRTCATYLSVKIRPYQNGSRKTFYYGHANGDTIILESTWELEIANLLDSMSLKWSRPEPLKWIDSNSIYRLYYPDFYLPDYDVFLDPKNPYAMDKDKEKMVTISKDYKVIYGSLDTIKSFLNKLA